MDQERGIVMHIPDPVVPTLSTDAYYSYVRQENEFRASVPGGGSARRSFLDD